MVHIARIFGSVVDHNCVGKSNDDYRNISGDISTVQRSVNRCLNADSENFILDDLWDDILLRKWRDVDRNAVFVVWSVAVGRDL